MIQFETQKTQWPAHLGAHLGGIFADTSGEYLGIDAACSTPLATDKGFKAADPSECALRQEVLLVLMPDLLEPGNRS